MHESVRHGLPSAPPAIEHAGAIARQPEQLSLERHVFGRRGRVVAVVVSIVILAASAGAALQTSMALFSASGNGSGLLGTKAIFPGERVTPPFSVSDASGGGAAVDRSAPLGECLVDGVLQRQLPGLRLQRTAASRRGCVIGQLRVTFRERGRRLDRVLLLRGPADLHGRRTGDLRQQRQSHGVRHRHDADA